jgi:hypothetical protein
MSLIPKSQIKIEFITDGEPWAIHVQVPPWRVIQELKDLIGTDKDVAQKIFASMSGEVGEALKAQVMAARQSGVPVDGQALMALMPASVLASLAESKTVDAVAVADKLLPYVKRVDGIGPDDKPLTIAEWREQSEYTMVNAMVDVARRVLEECSPDKLLERGKK